jgi:hypothetical protein
VRRFWKPRGRSFDLESELRRNRPEPGPEFVRILAQRLDVPDRPSLLRSFRLASTAALTGVMLVVLAAVGGVSYAVTGATEALESVGTALKSGPSIQKGGGGGNPNEDQYRPGCGRGDRNHEHTGPPGDQQGFEDPCPVAAGGNPAPKEGNARTAGAQFTVSIVDGLIPSVPVSVAYATLDGTATALTGDYTPATGTVTFGPGETIKTVTVLVKGDRTPEPDETFFLKILNPSANAIIVNDTAQATIRNDD